MKVAGWICALAALAIAGPAWAQRDIRANPADYEYAVTQGVKIPGGQLLILQDARISQTMSKQLFEGCADPFMEFGENDPRTKMFQKKPLPPARYRQVDAEGKTVAEDFIEGVSPTARIHEERLGSPDNPVLLVEENDYACFGSYSGRVTYFFQAQDGRFGPVRFPGADGKTYPVAMVQTLKSASRLEKADAPNILVHRVDCHPDWAHSPKDFVIDYITIRYDGQRWSEAERSEPGFWEDERAFPPLTKFPD